MTNAQRRQIVDEAKSRGYQGSYVDLFRGAAFNPDAVVQAGTQEGIDGLRPAHQAGNTDASMAFTDVPPNTPFNTVGMKAPIDIKKYDEQGHLVKSYESVPPGVDALNTGPSRGTVIETPSARLQWGDFTDLGSQGGGFDESGNPIAYLDAVTLEQHLADTRGQDRDFWKATADTLAFHESGPHQRMDPRAVQVGGGPGRGLLQFEPEAFNTAKVRYEQIAKLKGFEPDPEIMKATSADQLSADQQYALFYSDLIQGKVKLSDYAEGKLPIADLWLQGHKKVEAPGDRESFEESRQAAKTELQRYGLRMGGLKRRRAQDGDFLGDLTERTSRESTKTTIKDPTKDPLYLRGHSFNTDDPETRRILKDIHDSGIHIQTPEGIKSSYTIPAEQYDFLIRKLDEIGNPDIRGMSQGDLRHLLFSGRAHTNARDVININTTKTSTVGKGLASGMVDQILTEIPHIQLAQGDGDIIGIGTLKNSLRTAKDIIDAGGNQGKTYDTPGTIEHTTHSVLEPELRKEYKEAGKTKKRLGGPSKYKLHPRGVRYNNSRYKK